VAEKFQALVTLGMANTRMKDFYDLWMLARSFEFDGDRLASAIGATFEQRRTLDELARHVSGERAGCCIADELRERTVPQVH